MSKNTREIIDSLKFVPLFKDIGHPQLEHLADITRKCIYKKNSIFLQQDEKSSHLFIILSGQVKISLISECGRELILRLLGKNDFFGEMSLLNENVNEAMATSITDVELLSISHKDFAKYIETHPAVALAIMSHLCDNLNKAYRQIESLVFLNVQSRIARIFLDMAKSSSIKTEKGIFFVPQITHQELANMVGTSRETVTKIITKFKTKGSIKITRDGIILTDQNYLGSLY
jgi:CRP-like cAMP-binding protein